MNTSTGGILPEPTNPALDRAIDTIIASLKSGGTVYTAGNGGSDAHAGHLAAELIGRFAYDRPPLRAVHLSSGGPVGSCIANDYGWEDVFWRQSFALCLPDDVLVCFSTSGRSRNIVKAFSCTGCALVAIVGPDGIVDMDDRLYDDNYRAAIHVVRSSATGTAAIQEEHQRFVHLVAERVEREMFPR